MHQNLPVPQDAEMPQVVEDRFGVDLDIWNMENNKYESLLDMKLAQGKDTRPVSNPAYRRIC